MTQPHRRVLREALPEVPADLLRAPPLRQQLGNETAQLRVHRDPATMMTAAASDRTTVRLERPIALLRCRVTPQLSRDRRRRTPDPPSGLPHTQPAAMQAAMSIRSSSDKNRSLISRTSRRSSGHNPHDVTRRILLVTVSPVSARAPRRADGASSRVDAEAALAQLHEPPPLR